MAESIRTTIETVIPGVTSTVTSHVRQEVFLLEVGDASDARAVKEFVAEVEGEEEEWLRGRSVRFRGCG